jgi:hypothetical protein
VSAGAASGPAGGPPLPPQFNLAGALPGRRLNAGDGGRVALECQTRI